MKATYYKAVRVMPDNTLVSQFIEHGDEWLWLKCKKLVYKEGEVTEAPRGSAGVFCYRQLSAALELRGNTCPSFHGTVAIHKAQPLHGAKRGPLFSPAVVRFTAIRLGVKVREYWHPGV